MIWYSVGTYAGGAFATAVWLWCDSIVTAEMRGGREPIEEDAYTALLVSLLWPLALPVTAVVCSVDKLARLIARRSVRKLRAEEERKKLLETPIDELGRDS